jgi:hypothetical protein
MNKQQREEMIAEEKSDAVYLRRSTEAWNAFLCGADVTSKKMFRMAAKFHANERVLIYDA